MLERCSGDSNMQGRCRGLQSLCRHFVRSIKIFMSKNLESDSRPCCVGWADAAVSLVISVWGILWGPLQLPQVFSVSFSSKGSLSLKVHIPSALRSGMTCRCSEHTPITALARLSPLVHPPPKTPQESWELPHSCKLCLKFRKLRGRSHLAGSS